MKTITGLLIVIFLLALPASATNLVVLTEHNPPFNYIEDDRLTGLSTDIFLEMTKDARLSVALEDIKLWPWARGYQEIKRRPNVILYSMARTHVREDLFQWIGPIYDIRCSVVARKDAKIRINDLTKDAERYTIGTVRESAPEQVLIERGVSLEHLQRVHDLDLNVKKLTEGRVDGVLFNEPAILYGIKRMGFNPDDYEVVHTMFTTKLYFAASKDMDPAVVKQLQKSLDKLRAKGKVDAIIKKYR